MAPLSGGCALSLPTQQAWRRKEKSLTDPIWSLKVNHNEKNITKPNEVILYYLHDGPKRGFVRKKLRRTCRHQAATCVIASPTTPPPMPLPWCDSQATPCGSCLQAPTICHSTCSAPAFLLIGAYHPSVHSHPSVCGDIYTPLHWVFVLLPVRFFLALWDSLWGHIYPSIVILHEITLAAQRNSASDLEFQLEQPRLLLTPFVPREPFFLACSELIKQCRTHHFFSKESQDSAKYRLSVSIWISSISRLSRNLSRQS